MIKINLTQEMFDFFLITMQAKKKRLLAFEISKVPERYMSIGGMNIDTGAITKEEKTSHNEQRKNWELKMNRTERAIDILLEIKEKATRPKAA